MRNRSSVLFVLFTFVCAMFAVAQTQPQPPHITYIKAGKLFDGTGSNYRSNVVIIVEGERIKSVNDAEGITIPAGADFIDLSNSYVLPGLIDCHTHLGARADHYDEIWAFKDTPLTSA